MSTEAGPAIGSPAPPIAPADDVTAASAPSAATAATARTAAEADHREASELGLREILREDFRRHYGSLAHPGLHVLAVYRLGQWRRTRRQPLRAALTVVYKVLNNLVIRNLYGVELSEQARLGRRVLIGHHQTILIPPFCEIGDDCTLRHNLTIGYAGGSASPRDVPKVGARVELAPGVHLLGAITIGDDARIGPGSIVMADVPAGSTVFAAPARIMKPPTR
ncbi:serine O-acetyltransferase [Frankia torreyi]|uniref:Serine O-acetyltransferase n=1 Tax=Frankia torreyi TaxID=1856 RepID=A0A0D8BLI1_9ACTN|nr:MULTISPECIES: serine acetyltransferase [Frankia]KJE24966.1 serine O-acetyltransferase [Frankia torreyi]KQM07157.1 serine O-acetyltransferase [Frankia sp. CpI1-P]